MELHRRSFLGLLLAAPFGFRLQAEPTVVGLDLAKGRDVTGVLLCRRQLSMPECAELKAQWAATYASPPRLTREEVARFFDIEVKYLGQHR